MAVRIITNLCEPYRYTPQICGGNRKTLIDSNYITDLKVVPAYSKMPGLVQVVINKTSET